MGREVFPGGGYILGSPHAIAVSLQRPVCVRCCAGVTGTSKESNACGFYFFYAYFVAVLLVCRPEGKVIIRSDL